ncbi:hypothetical protein GGH94_001509 [Coemansia aciculifera]|uniref:LysM domain-containing protein n=1 Tax=Coemansia aciculifera TaxID=417176 RepID=A0A9W8IL65_9FUNG|nr:hypothetical protein GGH94_001509 [Coemansia aciculifera]KAJ2876448.1 hypothetical protein GGH93_000765 [Coemansia aciculifera]
MFGYLKYLGALAATLSLLATPTAAVYSNYKVTPPSIPCILYEIRPGDYCYKIAVTNGISYKQFLAQNPGIDCTRLYVGQSVCLIPLNLPGSWGKVLNTDVTDNIRADDNNSDDNKAKNLNNAAPCKAYAVQEGDVCSQIAEENALSVDKLVEINESSPLWDGCNSLLIGQTICVA